MNGKIITMDKEGSIAEAVAISGERITRVGKNEEIQKLIEPTTVVIELKGKIATPGLIDSHCHSAICGIKSLFTVNMGEADSIAEVVRKVNEKVKQTAREEWIRGEGMNKATIKEGRYPNRWELDEVSPNNPVFLVSFGLHEASANSYALRLANITKDTPDPPGGKIARDEKGEPIGQLVEGPAIKLVSNKIPDYSIEQYGEAIKKIQGDMLKEGITAIKEMIQIGNKERMLTAYQNLNERGELVLRTYLHYETESLVEISEFVKKKIEIAEGMLKLGGIKIWFDGSVSARTACVYEDWNKNYDEIDVGNRGCPVMNPDEFSKMVKVGHKAGFQISVHAPGDRAIDMGLDAFEEASKETHRENCRHSIIHCQLPTPSALDRMKRLGNNLIIETQSAFLYGAGDALARSWGPKRSKKIMPLRTFVGKGIIVCNSSDAPVVPFAPRYGLWAAIVRRAKSGWEPFGTDESITIEEALRTYTTWGARSMFMENEIGSIEPEKYADIVVWSDDLYDIPVEKIKDIKAEMTIVGGKILHKVGEW